MVFFFFFFPYLEGGDGTHYAWFIEAAQRVPRKCSQMEIKLLSILVEIFLNKCFKLPALYETNFPLGEHVSLEQLGKL